MTLAFYPVHAQNNRDPDKHGCYLRCPARDEDEFTGEDVPQEAEEAEQLICEQKKVKQDVSIRETQNLQLHLTFTLLCAFCDVDGCSKYSWTHKDMQRLIPVGNQHQHRRRRPHHLFLWTEWILACRVSILNQVDTARFMMDNGVMKSHGG